MKILIFILLVVVLVVIYRVVRHFFLIFEGWLDKKLNFDWMGIVVYLIVAAIVIPVFIKVIVALSPAIKGCILGVACYGMSTRELVFIVGFQLLVCFFLVATIIALSVALTEKITEAYRQIKK